MTMRALDLFNESIFPLISQCNTKPKHSETDLFPVQEEAGICMYKAVIFF